MTDRCSVDMQRRFGGLERLYGPAGLGRLSRAHVVVAGIGGVGSWCAEALARTGIGALTLIDLDHIAESNINRQLHALSDTLGQAKVMAMAQRVRGINPECDLRLIDDFVDPDNVSALIAADADFVIDCTDQSQAKIAMILESRLRKLPILVCGGAGGKTNPLSLRAGDISMAVNDAMLAKLRNALRRQHRYPKASDHAGKPRKRVPRMGVRTLWFDQPTLLPEQWAPLAAEAPPSAVGLPHAVGESAGSAESSVLQGLSCAGYGSVVTVTAAMGLAAANEAVQWLVHGRYPS